MQLVDDAVGPMGYEHPMAILGTLLLFALTALAEIVGCYLVFLWRRQQQSAWLLIPATVALALFAWLLTLHPTAAARTYATYGGVYIGCAVVWLWAVEGQTPNRWDLAGVALSLAGALVIVVGWSRPVQTTPGPQDPFRVQVEK